MSKRQTRKTISMSAKTYAAFATFAARHGRSMSGIVEQMLIDLLARGEVAGVEVWRCGAKGGA